MPTASDKILILVPHTHWDREWYQTFQGFRRRLVRLIDRLLTLLDADPKFPAFTLDGQTVVLEDYLEIRPERKDQLRRFVEQERILVGPWYVLADEFLVSGEALVRNLMLGHMIGEACPARDFGRVMKAGYIPDPFGHIAQMPQILAGFGLDSAILTRGLGDEGEQVGLEFAWKALDGTPVLAIHQIDSYCNFANWGYVRGGDGSRRVDYDEALEKVNWAIQRLSPRARTPCLLLNNGCDHLEPQPELRRIIKAVNERLKGARVVAGTFEDFVKGVKASHPRLEAIQGELHSGRYHPLLSGTLSSRMYLKQENEATQIALEKWAEPLSALAWAFGRPYEDAYLWRAWRFCVQNHPHDSICGCSIDQVHRDMMPRFQQARQIAEDLSAECVQYLAERIDTSFPKAPAGSRALLAFNPHGWESSGLIQNHVAIPLGPDESPYNLVVTDGEGGKVPTQILNQGIQDWRGGFPRDSRVWEFDLCFKADRLPAAGWRSYCLQRGKPEGASDISVEGLAMSNAHLGVSFNPDGTLDLTHKATGHVFRGLHIFESTEDVGDEYDYSPAAASQTFTSLGCHARIGIEAAGPVCAIARVDLDLEIPESVAPGRKWRSESLVKSPITAYVTLAADSPRLDFRTIVDNRARDHRLRVVFPTGLRAGKSCAETAFGVVERPVDLPSVQGWSQNPVPTQAQRSFVDASDGAMGLAVFNSGLPEYELRKDQDGTSLCLTLLRCVGYLSRDDAPARPYNAGPTIPTPDAQCQGISEFHYSIMPHEGDWQQGRVWMQSHQHLVPPRLSEVGRSAGKLPREFSLVRVSPPGVVLSALKRAESKDALVVRVYNTTPKGLTARVKSGLPVRSAKRVNLNEEPSRGGAIEVTGGTAKVPLRPFEIATLAFRLKRGIAR